MRLMAPLQADEQHEPSEQLIEHPGQEDAAMTLIREGLNDDEKRWLRSKDREILKLVGGGEYVPELRRHPRPRIFSNGSRTTLATVDGGKLTVFRIDVQEIIIDGA